MDLDEDYEPMPQCQSRCRGQRCRFPLDHDGQHLSEDRRSPFSWTFIDQDPAPYIESEDNDG